ncbi:MAG: hypothetical protein AAFP81_17410 [Pseudomonadota bacterium]
MDDILVSDIMGIFTGDNGLYVRVRRPDRSFIEGDISEEDAVQFSARLKKARETDDSVGFDVSMVSGWRVAD